jgi:glycosyltransferase involved in cell wall biosynthesis
VTAGGHRVPPASAPVSWHVLTGEYPPQPGGVSDYTRLVARALARAGERVHVWAPGAREERTEEGVQVHREPGLFTPLGLARLTRALERMPGPRRLLLQYVPHAFGMKAMNVPFCAWFSARKQDERWIFFHEVVYPWNRGAPLRHQVLAGATRVMAQWVAGNADRTFVSIPAWKEHLPEPARTRAEWRPVPSTLPTEAPPEAVARLRAELGPGPWVGHFGTYGKATSEPLERVLVPLLRAGPERRALLLGRGSQAYAAGLEQRHPELAGRVVFRDSLSPEDAAVCMKASDVLVQPYPDGVSARRTTTMAGLALGVPLVTNTGHLTEPVWRGLGAAALAEGTDPAPLVSLTERLLSHPQEREALGRRAAEVYRERFSLECTVDALRAPAAAPGQENP